jgi:hypothetical protein
MDKGLFWCARCGGRSITELIQAQANGDWVSYNGSSAAQNGQPKRRELSEAMVAGWHSALMSNESSLRWLRERRGLMPQTVERFEIGMDKASRAYTIPIRDRDGKLTNIRYYNPAPGTRRKIWSEAGYGSPPSLYPLTSLAEDPKEIIICGGEWDALLALQNGYTAITRTAGEDYWRAEWNELFRDKTVYLAHDCDDKGQKANKVVARYLRNLADVRIIKFPYPITEKRGKDLTDYLLDHMPGDLRTCMEAAQPFLRSTLLSEPRAVSMAETKDPALVGQPVQLKLTVTAKKEPGYLLPKKVHFFCTQDAGSKCAICPLKGANGEADIEIVASNKVILEMVDSNQGELAKTLATLYGIPTGKCVRLEQEVEEYQAVEVLYGSTYLGEERQQQAMTLKMTSVGQFNTVPNNTVSVIGALYPNPKSHTNEFLVHELNPLATTVDRFQITPENIALMKRFQSSSPLNRLYRIARTLSEHVTMIRNRTLMHILMDLTFHSVLSFTFADEHVSRGWLESLIVGDTRTGKSQAATALAKHYQAGEVVSCETASLAGIMGGLQQMGGRGDWAITWGVVPLNDRQLVVLDEVGGLTHDQIAQMSDIRSSGIVKLTKIQRDEAWARTRLLWLGNPRDARMENYTYGVDAIQPLIGNSEDIARFDLAMAVTNTDISMDVFNRRSNPGELKYTSEACHALLMWVWSRTSDQVFFNKAAERTIFFRAEQLGGQYTQSPPLIQAANIRIKLARIAAAIAARTFSTDRTHKKVVILPEHVEAAVEIINKLYGMEAFGYLERSKEEIDDEKAAATNRPRMKRYLFEQPELTRFLKGRSHFRRQDLEEILELSREEANGITGTLWKNHMIRKEGSNNVIEPTLHGILREIA